jgi:tetratricopeptide (TPR) repeat protein
VLLFCLSYKLSNINKFLIYFFLAIGAVVKGYRYYNVEKNYRNAINLYMAGYIKDAGIELQKTLSYDDEKSFVLYIQTLILSYQKDKEQEITKLVKKYPSETIYKMLGDYYSMNNQPDKAERAYITAINMVPNRYIPRKALLDLYIAQRKINEARVLAQKILSLAVKVDSYQVKKIKLEAVDFLKRKT